MGLQEIDATQGAVAGGKGANLGQLTRVAGVRVPPGFCVTTEAFRQAVDAGLEMPEDVANAIRARVRDGQAYAVRSSATAEDLPTASFAGQHDSYLDVVGAEDVLRHVSRCWGSLLTERAVAYRQHNGIADDDVAMAVVVQEMVPADAAGVLFTADPMTSNRKVTAVEAVPGLGEALVSGQVNPDRYLVRDGSVVEATMVGERPTLTDPQLVRLAELGRAIEAYFGRPQDIEWCLAGDDFAIVQSRPITTLFPVPDAGDAGNHLYLSVGHQQMMTDAMKPLGLSLHQLIAKPRMYEAASRLFVDIGPMLATPARQMMIDGWAEHDPLIGDALKTVVARDGFLPPVVDEGPAETPRWMAPTLLDPDPAYVTEMVQACEASNAALAREIEGRSGPGVVAFVMEDVGTGLQPLLFDPRSNAIYMTAMNASAWLNEHLGEWLGETNPADTLTLSAPGNVTSEMGLALLDVADAVRPYADSLDDLPAPAREAVSRWLDVYGMRCVGEIDITRTRWSERPSLLNPLILSNIKHFEPGEGARRFEDGRRAAADKEADVLERLRALPDGEAKAAECKLMIDRVRTFIGYREYPKYFYISRFAIYKRALMKEADRLVEAGVLGERDDVFFLTMQEFRDGAVDLELIARRREAFAWHETLSPPRVMTSEGEVITGSYRREDTPDGALVGLAVSSGTFEGRARVIHDVADADLEPGDILVTAGTDPSWSPLFLAIGALVTEVGGLMTHGAVVAREYGLPAVVGVENATRLIPDGARIRVHGTEGYVEILT